MSDFLNFSIQTRTDFKNWILRQLGYPFVIPEVREEHLDDFINESVEEWGEYAINEQDFLAINLRDYEAGKGIILPSNVLSVINLYDYGVHNGISNGINPFSFNYMMVNGGFTPNPFNGRTAQSGWLDFHMVMSWLDLSYQMSGKGFEWQYNNRTKMLTLYPDPIKFLHLSPEQDFNNYNSDDGNFIVAEVYTLRPEEQTYGESWIKRMALAKAKFFIGNLRKTYPDVSLPGGTKINGDDYINQATTEQEALRADLTKKFPVLAIFHG